MRKEFLRRHRRALANAVYVPENRMGEYEFATSAYTVGRKWIYYYVNRIKDNKRMLVKLKYNKKYDWEFER